MRISDRPAKPWSGRYDGDGDEHRRWHQAVVPLDEIGGSPRRCVFLGFRSDEGVRRNQGRPGAATAPDELRAALAGLAFPRPVAAAPSADLPADHAADGLPADAFAADAGDICVEGGDLEAAQDQLGASVAALIDAGEFPVVLGGGHETAFGSYLGLAGSGRVRDGARLGVLNLDAHFDLRGDPRPSSGTPFRQMAKQEEAAGRRLNYAVVGISEPNNTKALFDTARSLSVDYLLDEDCGSAALGSVLAFVDQFLARIDALYLTIDLDVLPAAVAPGVSAPAAYGVPLEVVSAVCRRAAESGKLLTCDVAELNPVYDVDGRTAKTAARLIHTIVRSRVSPAAR